MAPAASGVKLLATTALQDSWGKDEPLVFLGEWCRLYDQRAIWEKRSHEIVPNHWDDREKLKRDHDRIKALHDVLLIELAGLLNRHHRIERSTRYWQMLLDPWLSGYLSVVWDRWECVRLAFEAHGSFETISLGVPDDDRPFFDYEDYIGRVLSDPWNHRIFLEIIAAAYSGRCVVRPSGAAMPAPASTGFEMSSRANPWRWKERILGLLDALLGRLPLPSRVLFYQSYFPSSALVRLNLAFGQAPRWYIREFRWPLPLTGEYGAPKRRVLSIELSPKDAFESFLFKRIIRDLPVVVLEGFEELRAKTEAIPLRPNLILTANAHCGNEIFKLWSAERVRAGAELVVMSHGEGLPMTMGYFAIEEDISDFKTTWTLPRHPKHARLPPNKLAARRFVSTREVLAVVGGEMPRYHYRAQSAPQGAQTLVSFEMICGLYSSLEGNAKRALLFRPYPNRGWLIRQRVIERLGADRVSPEKTYERFLARARLIVCTYPQTTFSEAMATGLPVVLLYPARLWETIPEMEPLLRKLRAAKIVFDDPASAAAHINSVWADPESWWSGSAVVDAREEFRRQVADDAGDWFEGWRSFIEGRLKKTPVSGT